MQCASPYEKAELQKAPALSLLSKDGAMLRMLVAMGKQARAARRDVEWKSINLFFENLKISIFKLSLNIFPFD